MNYFLPFILPSKALYMINEIPANVRAVVNEKSATLTVQQLPHLNPIEQHAHFEVIIPPSLTSSSCDISFDFFFFSSLTINDIVKNDSKRFQTIKYFLYVKGKALSISDSNHFTCCRCRLCRRIFFILLHLFIIAGQC